MKTFILVCVGLAVGMGCARVQVEAPKDPIKVDISMRLDVYQHVVQDIDAIENIVSGPSQEPQSRNFFGLFVTDAYAVEGLNPEVEAAALRRKDRRLELISLESQGIIGENRSGLVEVRMAAGADASTQALVQAENSDRMIIYQGVAEKNGTSVGEVQKIYAKRLQDNAPGGTPIEVMDGASGAFQWKVK